jgi:chromosome segregation ATPase
MTWSSDTALGIAGPVAVGMGVAIAVAVGITVTNEKAGMIVTLYFSELPKEVQERFHYNLEECDKYQGEQAQAAEQQSEESRRQGEENEKKNKKEWEELEEHNKERKRVKELVANINQLQQEKDDLERRIAEENNLPKKLSERSLLNRYTHRYRYDNPARADLPDLKNRLNEVNRDLQEAAKQLHQLQQAQQH